MEKLSQALDKTRVNQERFNSAIREYFNNLQNPTPIQKMEYCNTVNGGTCIFCKKPWKEACRKNPYAEYKYFIPDCDCIKEKEKEKRLKLREELFNKRAKIPSKYHACNLRGMDLSVDLKTVDAIKQVEKYYTEKKYKSMGLILYGDIGTGKTHIAIAIMKAIAIREGLRASFIHASDFLTSVIKSKSDYLRFVLKRDIILLDDLDKANTDKKSNSKWVEEQFFSLINGITSNQKILIGTSNIKQIDDLSEIYNNAIVSRLLSACYFVKVCGNDYRMIQRDKIS